MIKIKILVPEDILSKPGKIQYYMYRDLVQPYCVPPLRDTEPLESELQAHY